MLCLCTGQTFLLLSQSHSWKKLVFAAQLLEKVVRMKDEKLDVQATNPEEVFALLLSYF